MFGTREKDTKSTFLLIFFSNVDGDSESGGLTFVEAYDFSCFYNVCHVVVSDIVSLPSIWMNIISFPLTCEMIL